MTMNTWLGNLWKWEAGLNKDIWDILFRTGNAADSSQTTAGGCNQVSTIPKNNYSLISMGENSGTLLIIAAVVAGYFLLKKAR